MAAVSHRRQPHPAGQRAVAAALRRDPSGQPRAGPGLLGRRRGRPRYLSRFLALAAGRGEPAPGAARPCRTWACGSSGSAAPCACRWYEAVQLLLGLADPESTSPCHVLATGWLHRCCGVRTATAYFLERAWPDGALSQTHAHAPGLAARHHRPAPLAAAAPGYRRCSHRCWCSPRCCRLWRLAGYASAGREVVDLRVARPAAWAELGAAQRWPDDALRASQVQTPERWIVARLPRAGRPGAAAAVVALALAAAPERPRSATPAAAW